MNIIDIKRDVIESKYIRALVSPYKRIQKRNIARHYLQSDYPAQIKELKNIHKGKKCYILGNGPSLTVKDLEMIKETGAYSIASNKIYSIYDKTSWRPSYYIVEDLVSIIDDFADKIDQIGAEKIILNWKAKDIIGVHENVIYGLFIPEFVINMYDYKNVYISEDCSLKFGWGGTVTFAAIQLAIYMGFSEIYLLGVDFNYQYYKDAKGKKHHNDVKQSHFSGGEYVWISYMNKTTSERGYCVAKQYCAEHGVIIKNATRGGKLEIFDRIALEDTFY